MRTMLALAALGTFPSWAQFENLSMTDDGGVVYFSTRLRPPGSSDSSWPKVYRLDGSGFQLAAQAVSAPGGSVETGGWMVEGASVSGDGGVVAFHSQMVCRRGTVCLSIPLEFSEIRSRWGAQRILGIAEVSRNGRYASTWRRTGFGLLSTPETDRERQVHRLDLQTGERVRVGPAPAEAGKWIGADGTILIGGWQLVTPAGGAIPMGPQPVEAHRAELSADTALVVYQAKVEPSELRIRDRSGADVLLATTGTSASISADSQKVLYLSPVAGKMQAFLWERGVAPRQVTREPDGLTEAVLSGTTGLAAAVTGAGALITVDVRNGFRSEFISPSPRPGPYPVNLFREPDPVYSGQAPGSFYSIRGENLASESLIPVPPLQPGAGEVQVFVNGTAAAVVSIAPEQVGYQVSWDTQESAPQERGEVVLRRGARAFEMVLSIRNVAATLPAFLSLGTEPNATSPTTGPPAQLYAIHGDWRGLVRRGDPAVEGEYLHLYGTGLGPVSPAVSTGVAGPASPPPAVSTPLSCGWIGDSRQPAEVAFAGLAPGLVGVYQVTVRVPEDLTIPASLIGLECFDGALAAGIPIRVTP